MLKQLHKETFVFDVRDPLWEAPTLEGIESHLLDEHSFELVLDNGRDLNRIFQQLSELGIFVTSMRNKANRLEELFVTLLEEDRAI